MKIKIEWDGSKIADAADAAARAAARSAIEDKQETQLRELLEKTK